MPGRRLFVAVPLPAEATERVAQLVDRVRVHAVRTRGRPGVRWVRLDGLHLTLRFLGPTPDERIESVAAAVRRAAADVTPIPVGIEAGGAFPDLERPRALWLGVGEGAASLDVLASRLEDELAADGWPRADRPFRPHLTLARTDGAVGAEAAARLLTASRDFHVEFTVDRLVLFESVTGGGPARYEPLAAVPLPGPG